MRSSWNSTSLTRLTFSCQGVLTPKMSDVMLHWKPLILWLVAGQNTSRWIIRRFLRSWQFLLELERVEHLALHSTETKQWTGTATTIFCDTQLSPNWRGWMVEPWMGESVCFMFDCLAHTHFIAVTGGLRTVSPLSHFHSHGHRDE